MNREIILNWSSFKQTIEDRNLDFQWLIEDGAYILYAQDGFLDIGCSINKVDNPDSGSDQEDFETNYKDSKDKRIGQNTYTSDDRLKSESKILGSDGNYTADVDRIDGVNRLRTEHVVTVKELLGTYAKPATWFTVDQADDGSSITVDIPDDSVNIQTDITSSEAGDLDAAAVKIKDKLNNDSTFINFYRAIKPEGSPRVFIESLEAGNTNERPDSGDFSVSTTSGAAVTVAYDNIVQRSVTTALFPHPQDPTKGTFSVTGEMTVVNQSVKDYNPGYMTDSNGNSNMKVDGSSTEKEFNFKAFPDRDYVVTSVKLLAEDGNINMHRFLDTVLSNGLLFKIKTDGEEVEFPAIIDTRDVLQIFASEGGFHEIKANKTAQMVFGPRNPFILKAGTNDKVSMTIRDDVSGMVSLSCAVEGYLSD